MAVCCHKLYYKKCHNWEVKTLRMATIVCTVYLFSENRKVKNMVIFKRENSVLMHYDNNNFFVNKRLMYVP